MMHMIEKRICTTSDHNALAEGILKAGQRRPHAKKLRGSVNLIKNNIRHVKCYVMLPEWSERENEGERKRCEISGELKCR